MGLVTWLGSVWLIKWIPAYAFQRHRPPPADVWRPDVYRPDV
jgi:hypothetical protein